jgi:murein DD-endopeptidase MepM/ murein hydrolase activator NlpD
MQILITTSALSRTRVLQFTPLTLVLGVFAMLLPMMVFSLVLYHAVVIKAAREHWPVISQAVRFVEKKEMAQRDRFMRENLDAMAEKVGDLQAKLMRLEAVSERVASMAGLNPEDLSRIEAPVKGASGGPLVTLHDGAATSSLTLEALGKQMGDLQSVSDREVDVFTLIESRLFEKRLEALMVPSSPPVTGPVGSGFGFRSDPFTHRTALHTGLDFPADEGTSIMAAAGGVVLSAGMHPQYGQLVELDHGNGLLTRYAHTSRMLVKQGDLVKRGQKIAEVGTTGRSTGPHLHFEVLVEGVQQNPAKFLASQDAPGLRSAQNPSKSSVASIR